MKQLLPHLLLLTAVTTHIMSCNKNTYTKDVTNTVTLPGNGANVVAANNTFAFKFLQATLQQDSSTNTNKLISPISIYLALSMVYNGAANATKDSIANALQLQGIDINSLNATCKSLIQQLPGEDNEVQLAIANSIWYSQDKTIPLQSFLDVNANFYHAAVKGLDFNSASSVDVINNWVTANTQGKVPSVLKSIDPADLMYLINAIYFKGGWQFAFKTSATHNDTFALNNGNTVNVPYMQQEITTNVFNNGQFRLIELPFGGGNSYSMYLADAATGTPNINQFAANLQASAIKTAIASMGKETVTLEMPKWESAYSIDDFKPVLTTLGMGITLGVGADFSNMYHVPVYISKAIHKTYIKVNEEGTTAAAVTVIGIQPTDISAGYNYRLNHPFVYIIAEKQTGIILFTGVLNNPLK